MDKIVIDILLGIRPEFDFTKSSNFISDGLLDSFDVISLVHAIDEKFNISIDGLDIIPENFQNIEKIINLINKNYSK